MNIQELTELCLSKKVDDDFLDAEIHSIFASKASDVNNSGLDGQIECLYMELGEETAEALIRELLEGV